MVQTSDLGYMLGWQLGSLVLGFVVELDSDGNVAIGCLLYLTFPAYLKAKFGAGSQHGGSGSSACDSMVLTIIEFQRWQQHTPADSKPLLILEWPFGRESLEPAPK